jgi:hypothetical protein
MCGLLLFLVVWRADAPPLPTFFDIVYAYLLGMLGLPVPRVVRVLALFWWLILVAILILMFRLLILSFAHRGTP